MNRKITIYKDDTFRGTRQFLCEGRFDNDMLGIGENQLSSLRVPPGMQAQLFAYPGWKPPTTTITSDTAYVGDRWSDSTSSIIVRDLGNPAAKATLWKHDTYRGSNIKLSAGHHDIKTLL